MKRVNTEVAHATDYGWMALLFAALYLSEGWYEHWARSQRPYSKARAMVLYDRVLTGRAFA